jgi:hypothetical protein
LDEDINKVSRYIFDFIIKIKTKDMAKDDKLKYGHTLEYKNLDDTAKDAVLEYIKAQMEKRDAKIHVQVSFPHRHPYMSWQESRFS